MGLTIESGFTMDLLGTMRLYIDTQPVDITTGSFTHQDFSGSISHSHGHTQLATTLQGTMRVLTGDNNFTVTYSAANKAYTIANPSTTFAINFSGNDGFLAKRILGFTDNQATDSSHTSDATPIFTIESRYNCPISWEPDYEASDVRWGGNHNGIIWGGGPTNIPKKYDMRIGFIDYTDLWKREATATQPWSWEDFVNWHASGEYFFVDGSTWYSVDHAHKLQAKSTVFAPVEATPGFQREYHLDLQTYIFR